MLRSPVLRSLAAGCRAWLVLAALAVCVPALVPASAEAQGSVAGDKAALEKLYDDTGGDSWSLNTNWKSNMPLNSWSGVTANAAGRVTNLSLGNQGLTGSLPAELGDLTELQSISITRNPNLGSTIPTELGSLSNLGTINFSGNDLDGAIPKELANLPLTSLSLDGNDLSGAIPKELGSLDMLTTLGLSNNELTGAIPEELGNLGDTLTILRLDGNSGLTGCVPHQLRGVETKNIGNLRFCTIPTLVLTPSSIAEGGMTTVTATLNTAAPSEVTLTVSAAPVAPTEAGDFTLSDNKTLTIAMGQTTSSGVVTITAVNNDEQSAADRMVTVSATTTSSDNVPDPDSETLTITDDDLPRGIEADRAALKAFYAATGGNGWTLRDRWSDIDTLTDFNDLDGVTAYPDGHARAGRVNRLDFSSNNLIGSLPAELGDLTELRDLFIVGDNGLTGPIPPELGTLPNLREINFRDNGLTGSIPAELADLPKLEQGLLLHGNDLTGPIPAELGKLDKLLSLQLQDNQLSGDVPVELADLADTLNVLRLGPGNSGLTGCVPDSLASVATLNIGHLDLCSAAKDRATLVALYNATGGPDWRVSNWNTNMPLSAWEGVTTNSVGAVTTLTLDVGLSGSLPPVLGDLSELVSLRISGNSRLTGEIPAELGRLPKLSVLRLNRNGLSGRIPLELGDLGDTLTELILTGNMPGLTGCVPYRLRRFAGTSGLTDTCSPRPTLVLTPSSIPENGGTATVTATLEEEWTENMTLTVSAAPGSGTVAGDFTLSANTVLTIEPGQTSSTGEVTITAVDNDISDPGRTVTVSAVTMVDDPYDPQAPQPVTLAIENDDDDKAGADQRDLELVLSGVARGLTIDAVDVLAGRFDASPSGGTQMTLAGHVLRLPPEGMREAGTRHGLLPSLAPGDLGHARWPGRSGEETGIGGSMEDLLTRSSFELALSDGEGGAGVSDLTLWSRASASGFSSSPETGFDMDGSFRSGWLGADYRVEPELLVGLAVSHATGTVDHERADGLKAETDVTLTSLVPYAHMEVEHGLELWGLLGAGQGDMEVTKDGGSDAVAMDLTSFMGAVGGRQALTSVDGIDLAARADAFASSLSAEGVDDLPDTSGNAQRVRLLVEGSTSWAEDADTRATPRVTLGARWDGGTADSGVGLEIGGGVAWTQTEAGIDVNLQGRYLLAHTADGYEDWGASLDLRFDPGLDGYGLMLGLSPVLGDAASSAESLYGDADLAGLAANDNRTGRLEAELAWGLPDVVIGGMVTPYAGLTLTNGESQRYRLGGRLNVPESAFSMSLEGERRDGSSAAADHGVMLRLRAAW